MQGLGQFINLAPEPAVLAVCLAYLAATVAEHLDLVLLDVGLPDITGFELCRELRAFSQLPVIFLTARGGEIDRVLGLELGADDYLAKPFSPRELAARVKALLRRAVMCWRAQRAQASTCDTCSRAAAAKRPHRH